MYREIIGDYELIGRLIGKSITDAILITGDSYYLCRGNFVISEYYPMKIGNMVLLKKDNYVYGRFFLITSEMYLGYIENTISQMKIDVERGTKLLGNQNHSVVYEDDSYSLFMYSDLYNYDSLYLLDKNKNIVMTMSAAYCAYTEDSEFRAGDREFIIGGSVHKFKKSYDCDFNGFIETKKAQLSKDIEKDTRTIEALEEIIEYLSTSAVLT